MDVIYRYDPFQPITGTQIADPEAATRALLDGNNRFADIVRRMQQLTLGKKQEPIVIPVSPISLGLPLIAGTTVVQAPFALVLGCSDARVPTETIFDQSANGLFVVRIAGNVLGTECLGSIDYAVKNMGDSLKLVLVLGHSGCGAVTAAVDGYLAPQGFIDIAFTHSLRSLVDRIQIAVRGAAKALRMTGGAKVEESPRYRDDLIETAVYLNAALTAYDLHREIRSLGNSSLRIAYGVYDLATLHVRGLPNDRGRPPKMESSFADAPETPEDFIEIGSQLAERLLGRGDGGASGEW